MAFIPLATGQLLRLLLFVACSTVNGRTLDPERHHGGLADVVATYANEKGVQVEDLSLLALGACDWFYGVGGLFRTSSQRARAPLSVITARSIFPQWSLNTNNIEVRVATGPGIRYRFLSGVRVPRPLVALLGFDFYRYGYGKYFDVLALLRPYILFIIIDSNCPPILPYATIQLTSSLDDTNGATRNRAAVRLLHDHWIVDRFRLYYRREDRNYPVRFQSALTNTGVTRIIQIHKDPQPRNSFSFAVMLNISVSFPENNTTASIYIWFSFVAPRDFTFLTEDVDTTLSIGCFRLLAVVEQSEAAFVAPLSSALFGILLSTAFCVATFVSLGLGRYGIHPMATTGRVLISVLAVFPVEISNRSRRQAFMFHRSVILGLFIVILQLVIVNVYKNEVTSSFLEPERDLHSWSSGDIGVHNWPLPYRSTMNAMRKHLYRQLTEKLELCCTQSDIIRDGLSVPLKRSPSKFIHLRRPIFEESVIQRSRILTEVREYALTPMIPKFLEARLSKLTHETASQYKYQLSSKFNFPRARLNSLANWTSFRELLTFSSELNLKHDILIKDHGDTVAISLGNIHYTLLTSGLLLALSMGFVLAEIVLSMWLKLTYWNAGRPAIDTSPESIYASTAG